MLHSAQSMYGLQVAEYFGRTEWKIFHKILFQYKLQILFFIQESVSILVVRGTVMLPMFPFLKCDF